MAISLSEKYFELEDDFDHAQAYCDYAKAYLALGKIHKAINAYKSALEREDVFPNLKTDAYKLYVVFRYTLTQCCKTHNYQRNATLDLVI